MKKIYFPLILIFLIFIISCEKEDIPDISEHAQEHFEVEAVKIPYESLPKDVQYFLKEKFKGRDNRNNQFGSPRTDLPAIKNKNAKGEVSYTIALKKILQTSNIIYFDNMVITEQSKDRKSIRILRYKPSPEWYNSTERLMNNYSGSVSFYTSNGDLLGELSLLNGEGSDEQEDQKDFSTTCTYTSSTLCVGDVNGGDSYSCTYNFTERCTTNYNSAITTTGPDDGGGTEGSSTGGGGSGGNTTTTPIPDEEEQNNDKPCTGDPVKNPELAPQLGASGLKGSLHGCTRYGGGCTGGEDGRNKPHDGIDIKNEFGDPIYAMYDGEVHSAYDHPGTGYVTRIKSIVNGETIIYQYFHMQKERLTTKGIIVKAGDLIGRQGDSGNLRRAIQQGYAISHVHIKISKFTGTGDSNNYKNYRSTNPEEYLGTSFDEKGESIDNNC